MMLLLLLAAPLDLGTREAGQVRARLAITVPGQGVGPGLAVVRLELEASGPDTMRIDGPRLEDALAAWHISWAASSWSAGREGWSAELEQTKPGVAGLPGVAVRVRSGPDDDWHDLAWHDPLGETLSVAPPAPLDDPPVAPLWPWIAGAAALLLVGAGTLLMRRPIAVQQLAPSARASAALDALAGTPAERFDGLVAVVRRYLAEEPDHGPLFAELLILADRARFAPAPPEQAVLDHALALSRRALGQAGQQAESGITA